MRFAVLPLVLLCACTDPASTPVTRTVRVALAEDPTGVTGWQPWQREAVRAHLPRLRVAGLAWVESDVATADVEIRPYVAAPGCAGTGLYRMGARYVQIDLACTVGAARVQFVVTHELLHHAMGTYATTPWYGHLCVRSGDRADCHPTVFGRGVTSALVPEGDPWRGEDPADPDPLPTEDDARLLRAVGVR